MTVKLQFIIASALSILVLAFVAVSPAVLADVASNADAACQGVELTGGSCNEETDGRSVTSLVNTIIDILSWVVGIAAVFVIIIAGLQFIISAGDSAKSAKARQAILYAIIGLVIVAIAQLIVSFVITRV
jgi:hypothetical protein